MPLLTTGARDSMALSAALSREDKLLVVCLCAAWCDTCEEFRRTFTRLADADPSSAYVWVDIEDESELLGDIDIENFPTLAVFRGAVPVFYGVTLPQEPVVARTLSAFSGAAPRRVSVPDAVAELPRSLMARSKGF
jgi:thioredoxin 1